MIPKFAANLLRHESPVINGDGSNSRDFTYVDDVVQANQLALLVENPDAINTVYNIAYGECTTLDKLFESLRKNLAVFDPKIAKIKPQYGPTRAGDIPHSFADISKGRTLLGYIPRYSVKFGLKKAAEWYYSEQE